MEINKKLVYIAIVVIILIGAFFIVRNYVKISAGQNNQSSQTISNASQNIGSCSPQCSNPYIESYCQEKSAYKKLHFFSCVNGECIEEIKEPELSEACSEKEECIDGICEPIALPIKTCGIYLNKKDSLYKLTNDIGGDNLTENCITIIKDNITLDCNGYSIYSDSNFSGIYSSENNDITIKNCDISMSNSEEGIGIYLQGNLRSKILNNTLNDQNIGLYLNWTSSSIINWNKIKSNERFGLFIEKSSNNEISNNLICDNVIQDIRIISSHNLKGIDNKFGIVDTASNNWPNSGTDYINCTS